MSDLVGEKAKLVHGRTPFYRGSEQKMNRAMCEQIGEQMMTMALDNLERDGYVAFATLLISREGEMTPVLLETVNDESKDNLAIMLRTLAPHLSAVVVISEAWRRGGGAAIAAL